MPSLPYILGTAGHIDHGKSSLVKALTGTDPDRLPEEKARGMTIDLGFAHLDLTDPSDPAVSYNLGIIDVPGHADFVKNMVAGVAGLDVALIVVAADDGWMPQTEEHLQILTYLGLTRAVIALTKSDLVEEPEYAAEMVRESLAGTPFAHAPIVPVAAPKGQGLTELKAALAAVLRETPPPADIGKPRLAVDRTFSPQGIGTVVTGTLTGGTFQRGQEAVVLPAGLKTHLRALQSHSSSVETARPGTRTALNLADLAIADREDKDGVRRGDVITLPSAAAASDTLDVLLEKSAREVHGSPLATKPLRNGQKVLWHHGGSTHEARVYFQGTRILSPGGRIAAQLRFSSPVFAFTGDRFVLRDLSRQATIAGGSIIDPDASRALFRKPRSRSCLESCLAAPDDPAVLLAAKVHRDTAVPRATALLKSRFSQSVVDATVERLTTAKTILSDSTWLLDADWWQQCLTQSGDAIKAHHKAQPQLTGMDLAEVSALATARLPDKKLLDLFIAGLLASGFVKTGRYLRWGAHRAALPPALQAAGAKIREALAKNLIEPPNPGEIAPDQPSRQALKFLLDTGEAIQLDEKAVLLAEGHEKLVSLITAHLQKAGQATASDLRVVTGTTRRILIPLLERLDREGITRRTGDFRSLKTAPRP
jgi:selenocysteine-specific elongation factor